MKNAFLFISLLFITHGYATDEPQAVDDIPKTGGVLVVNQPTTPNYNYINFPRLNFIVKRGGVANYKSVYGEYVVVKEVNTENDGTVYVQLEPKNGKKFFGFLKRVKANYGEAIKSGELSTL